MGKESYTRRVTQRCTYQQPSGITTPTETPTPTATATQPPEQTLSAKYFYDGDGAMVKSIVNGVITYYPGRHYNKTVDGVNDKVEKYYVFASLTVAMRTIENGTDSLQWLLADHLGSTSVTANNDGSLNGILKYSAFGEIWASSGTTLTDYRYTNQLEQSEIGLYYYNARWYDPELGRFVQADTIVPGIGKTMTFDRYTYVLNNPIIFTDVSGHITCDAYGNCVDANSEFMYSMTVNLSSSNPTNIIGAQLSMVQGYSDEYPLSGNGNLSGDISLAMIYETATGKVMQLGYINRGRIKGPANMETTSAYEVAQQFSATFPSGWFAEVYYLSYRYNFKTGQIYSSQPGALAKSMTSLTSDQIIEMLSLKLLEGKYLIVGVALDVYSGLITNRNSPDKVGHWSVVTSVSNSGITINNPYTNSAQTYSWNEFLQSFQYNILSITPARIFQKRFSINKAIAR